MKFRKTLAAALSLLLLLQTGSLAASAVTLDTEADYQGTILAAINTNYQDLSETFSAYCEEMQIGPASEAAGEQRQSRTAEDGVIDAVFDDAQPLSALEAANKEKALGRNAENSAEQAEYRVGDRKKIRSNARSEYESRFVDVECEYVGTYCTVWRDTEEYVTAEKCVRLGEQVDEMIPKEWEVFGRKCIDTDGDGRFAVFIYKLDSGYGGYFSTSDLADRYGRIGKVWTTTRGYNHCDCVNVYPNADMGTVLHEYQHYLHAGYKYADKNNLTFLSNATESYINEGFSCCAEYLLDHYNRAGSFANYASQTDVYSLVNWSFDSGAYTISYVFSQYLRTRYAQIVGDWDQEFPGVGIYKLILETRASKRVRNTLSIAADILYPKEQYPQLKTSDSRCRQLLVDFWLAVLCKEDSGIYGFNGESWADRIQMNFNNGLPENGSRKIRSAMCAYYQVYSPFPSGIESGTAHVTQAGKDMVFVGVDAVGRKITYNWNNGLWVPSTYLRLSDTDYVDYADPIAFKGRLLLGWSTDPNAESPQYTGSEKISLTKDETILYAVWDEERPIEADQSMRVSGVKRRVFRFTPMQDGYYALYANSANAYILDDLDRDPDKESIGWENGYSSVYYLHAGTGYNIFTLPHSIYHAAVVRIEPVPAYNTLRYYCVTDGTPMLVHESKGWNRYRIETLDDEQTQAYLRQNRLEFVGWATTPNAQTPDVFVGTILEPSESVASVYAVLRPMTALQAEQTQTIPDNAARCYVFTPGKNGTYEFALQNKRGETPDAAIKLSGDFGSVTGYASENNTPVRFSLQGGKTVFVQFYFYTGITDNNLYIRKISDKSMTTLTLVCGDTMPSAMVMKGKFEYIIPNITPVDSDGMTFCGWSEQEGADTATYKAGDTVPALTDRTLYAVWQHQADYYNQAHKLLALIRNWARALLQIIRYIVTVEFRF